MKKVELDATLVTEILEHFKIDLNSARESRRLIKEKFPEFADAILEFSKEKNFINSLEIALGLNRIAKIDDPIELVKSLGIYGRAGRKGRLVERVKPKDLHENRAWESDFYGISKEDYWVVYFPSNLEARDGDFDDSDLECVVHRTEFIILDPDSNDLNSSDQKSTFNPK